MYALVVVLLFVLVFFFGCMVCLMLSVYRFKMRGSRGGGEEKDTCFFKTSWCQST